MKMLPHTLASSLIFSLVLPALGQSVSVAVIGDYGTADSDEADLKTLVNSTLKPDSIVTVGDNNYRTATDYDKVVGQYFGSFIGNYTGTYGAGSATNRFWPAIGNHDYFDGYGAYLDYFKLPGNERYYTTQIGPITFFILNNDPREPDGVESTSKQAMWLKESLLQASSPWKIVALHYPPYSSGGSTEVARWPFKQWGADAVVAGHIHNYERLTVSGLPYFVNGLGGAERSGFGTPLPESESRFNADEGAMLLRATQGTLDLEFYPVGKTESIDHLQLLKLSPTLRPSITDKGKFRLEWTETGISYDLEKAVRLPDLEWEPSPFVVTRVEGACSVELTPEDQFTCFRLKRSN